MLGDSYVASLRTVPLSDNTVERRISRISEDIFDQLIVTLRSSYFSLQVDEATDTVKDSHLIAYVRYILGNDIKEDFLFCKIIQGNTTSSELFSIINQFFEENNIKWEMCVGLCTDGARSMSGKYNGLQALIKEVASQTIWTHCMLHRQSLVSKHSSEELDEVFQVIIRVINFIKGSSLRARLFTKLCEDMEAEYTSLLYYCEVRWLSRAKTLKRVFDLREEIFAFLRDHNRDESIIFSERNFILKLSYMVDIFDKLSLLNTSMQGTQVHIFNQSDKVTAFLKKLDLWVLNLKKNIS
jgi:zinc finger BED domain-containing protein 5/7/8/9